jgi:translation initiation factor 1A
VVELYFATVTMGKSNGRARKKNAASSGGQNTLLFTDGDEQQYAVLGTAMGNNRFNVVMPDLRKVMGIIRGNLRKRVWFVNGDMVMVSTRDFQADKVDIIHKDNETEAKLLNRYGEISPDFWGFYCLDARARDTGAGAGAGAGVASDDDEPNVQFELGDDDVIENI